MSDQTMQGTMSGAAPAGNGPITDENGIDSAPEGRQLLQIQSTMFTIAAPYKEGYALKTNEAGAMNQLLAENIRNNTAPLVRSYKLKVAGWSDEQIKAGKAEQMTPVVEATQLNDTQKAEVQAQIDEYVQTYEFGLRAGRVRMSPFEKEIDAIVVNMLDTALKSKGYSPSKMQKEEKSKYDALYNRVLQANKPAIEAEAQKRIKEQQAFVGALTLDMSEPTEEEVQGSEGAAGENQPAGAQA